jgi:hypothetical protein
MIATMMEKMSFVSIGRRRWFLGLRGSATWTPGEGPHNDTGIFRRFAGCVPDKPVIRTETQRLRAPRHPAQVGQTAPGIKQIGMARASDAGPGLRGGTGEQSQQQGVGSRCRRASVGAVVVVPLKGFPRRTGSPQRLAGHPITVLVQGRCALSSAAPGRGHSCRSGGM